MALPSCRCCPVYSANQAARLLPINPRRVPLSGRGALYDLEPRPRTVGYVYGLGGRDITPAHFHTVFARLQAIAAGGELGPVYTHLGQRG